MHNKDVRSYSCAHKTSLNTFELTGHQQVLQLIANLRELMMAMMMIAATYMMMMTVAILIVMVILSVVIANRKIITM